MSREELVNALIGQLTDEGFTLDEEEKSYTLIDYRGTHKVVTYWIEGMWITFTMTVEDVETIPFEEMLKS